MPAFTTNSVCWPQFEFTCPGWPRCSRGANSSSLGEKSSHTPRLDSKTLKYKQKQLSLPQHELVQGRETHVAERMHIVHFYVLYCTYMARVGNNLLLL